MMRTAKSSGTTRRGYSLLSLLILTAIVAVCLASVRLAVLRTAANSAEKVWGLVAICGVVATLVAIVLSLVLGWRWYQVMAMIPAGALLGAAGGAVATLSFDWPLLLVGPLAVLLLAWNSAVPTGATGNSALPHDRPKSGPFD